MSLATCRHYNRTENEKKATENQKKYFLRMSIAIFGLISIMAIELAKYLAYFTEVDDEILGIVNMAEFIFATPVLFYSGWIFFKGAYFGLKNKIINIDFLVSWGATLAYIYSLHALFGGTGDTYFASVAMIITFVLLGRYLEVLGKKSAVDTIIKRKSQIPLETTLVIEDGEVISGFSSFDESSISGESLPLHKTIGDAISNGTINTDSVSRYKAMKNYAKSTWNNTIELLEDSLNSKLRIEETVNKMSIYFPIIILSLSLATFFGWYLRIGDFENSLIISISVIIIACPYALALATPIASFIGISWLLQEGLLFKEAKFIETFAKIDAVVFDKTGTITTGKLTVKDVALSLTQLELNMLYSLSDSSTHPVSVAIKQYLKKNYDDLKKLKLDSIEQITAMGIRASYNGNIIYGGKLENNIEYKTTIYHFGINDKLLATFELEDILRDDALETIQYFKDKNIKTILCSGDNNFTVAYIAKALGIDYYNAEMSPVNKADYIKSLKDSGQTIVMVGDGINDSLALSRADISIAMGNSTDITVDISDIVILNAKLSGICKSHYISQRTFRFIKQNLTILLIYNAITIPIAMAGYVIPLLAVLSMSFSSLLVLGNCLRIQKMTIDE